MLKLDVPAWNIALRIAAIYLVALNVRQPVKYLKHQWPTPRGTAAGNSGDGDLLVYRFCDSCEA